MHTVARDQLRILVVDDSPTGLKHTTDCLQAQGYNVQTASDGEEALEFAREVRPHLIVLDIILPKKNGFQVCRQLKTDPVTQDVKILLLSSKSQAADKFWGIKQGADDYATRPVVRTELLAKVDALLSAPPESDSGEWPTSS